MRFNRTFLFSLLAVFLFSLAFVSGYLVHSIQVSPLESFPVLFQAYTILDSHGLKDLPPAPSLEYGMIRGMLQSYDDPYTLFVAPPQHELETNALTGSFGGIGVRLGNDSLGNVVLFPFPDGPARSTGIQDGDRLIAVEDLQVTSSTPSDTLQSAIRGPVGEIVTLTVARAPDFTPFTVKIKRSEIALPSVTWHLAPEEPRLGVVELNILSATSPAEIQRAVKDLNDRGATFFVLDLRNNPGGLLSAGVDVARLFLKDGEVIEQQTKGESVKIFRVEKPGPLSDLSLALFIDHGSASASEIIAGSLKVHQRAVLIGSPSYGKDTIQLIFDLSDGSSLHVTSAHWWVPGLIPPLGGVGIQPDVLVEATADKSSPDPFIRAAIETLIMKK